MNAIMSRKLREGQDSDKSLHNFTKRRFAGARGGAELCSAWMVGGGETPPRQPAGRRRYATMDGAEPRPHTDLGRWLALRRQGVLQLGGKLLGLLVGELELTVEDEG